MIRNISATASNSEKTVLHIDMDEHGDTRPLLNSNQKKSEDIEKKFQKFLELQEEYGLVILDTSPNMNE